MIRMIVYMLVRLNKIPDCKLVESRLCLRRLKKEPFCVYSLARVLSQLS